MHTHWCNCEGFVQPADHFQHVQRQRYALYVPGELAKPCVHSPVGTFVHTGCLRRRRLSPPRPLDPSPALIHMPPPQGATKFNQPLSFDTSEVTSMSAMFYGGSGHVRYTPVPWHSHAPRTSRPFYMRPLAFYPGRARPSTSR